MKRILVAVAVLLACTTVLAQSVAPRPGDPFGRFLFPPELVMAHQSELALDPEQREAIKNAAMEAERIFLDLKWELHAETEKLAALLEPTRVDTGAVLEQAEVVMNLEKEIKKTHIGMLARIKNALTETQQRKLGELRRGMTPPAPPAPPTPPTRPSSSVLPPAPEPAPAPSAVPAPPQPEETATLTL
jgi:Spy/CpxP family protein refolding chaperone